MSLKSQFNVERQEGQLDNGVRVVLYERPGMPIAIHADFISGSRFDPEGKEGIAHFVEHMLVAGTKKFPSKDKLANYIEQIGGIFGADTSRELLRLKFQLAEENDIDNAALLMNEMINDSLLNDKLVETERGSILQEIDKHHSNPPRVAAYGLNNLIYQGTDLEHDILGSTKTVSRIAQADIHHYFKSFFNPKRVTILASGGVGLKKLINSLNSVFGSSSGDVFLPPTAEPRLNAKRVSVHEFDINDQVSFRIGFRAVGFRHPDATSLKLLGTILGGGRASTLNKILRYERGLVYGISAGHFLLSDTGRWDVSTACAKDKLGEVLSLIYGELQRVYDGRISLAELEFSKNKSIKSLKRGLQTSESWVNAHTGDEVFKTGETVLNMIARIEGTSIEDVRRAGRKYFKPGSLFGAFAGRLEKVDLKY